MYILLGLLFRGFDWSLFILLSSCTTFDLLLVHILYIIWYKNLMNLMLLFCFILVLGLSLKQSYHSMNCTSVIYKTWGNTCSNSMFVKLNEIMFKIKIRHVLLLIQMKRHQSQSFNRIGILICGHVVLQFLQNSAVDMENCQTRDQTCCLWYTNYCHKNFCYSPS